MFSELGALQDYLFVILADFLLGIVFIGNKKYQQTSGSGMISGLHFTMLTGFTIALAAFFVNGAVLHVTPFSVLMAFLQTAAVAAYTLISFRMLKDGMVSIYSMFLMTGGMLVPYIWGIAFLDEALTLPRTLGILVIAVGVVLANSKKGKPDARFFLMGCAVFLLNGMTSVCSKVHQIETEKPVVSSVEFVILTALIRGIVSFLILVPVILHDKKGFRVWKQRIGRRVLLLILAISCFNGVSSYLLVSSAARLPATVLYPLNTGGTIAVSFLLDKIIFRGKTNRKMLIGAALCIIGTLLFL